MTHHSAQTGLTTAQVGPGVKRLVTVQVQEDEEAHGKT